MDGKADPFLVKVIFYILYSQAFAYELNINETEIQSQTIRILIKANFVNFSSKEEFSGVRLI